MSSRGKRVVVPVVVAIATLGQIGLAGVALSSRVATEREVEQERRTTAVYAAQLTALQNGPTAPLPAAKHTTLLASPDVAGTLRVLQTIADDVGVELTAVRALPSATPGRQAFTIAGKGTPERVCALFAAIEQHERLMVIENGKVAPGGEIDITFEVGLSTHYSGGSR